MDKRTIAQSLSMDGKGSAKMRGNVFRTLSSSWSDEDIPGTKPTSTRATNPARARTAFSNEASEILPANRDTENNRKAKKPAVTVRSVDVVSWKPRNPHEEPFICRRCGNKRVDDDHFNRRHNGLLLKEQNTFTLQLRKARWFEVASKKFTLRCENKGCDEAFTSSTEFFGHMTKECKKGSAGIYSEELGEPGDNDAGPTSLSIVSSKTLQCKSSKRNGECRYCKIIMPAGELDEHVQAHERIMRDMKAFRAGNGDSQGSQGSPKTSRGKIIHGTAVGLHANRKRTIFSDTDNSGSELTAVTEKSVKPRKRSKKTCRSFESDISCSEHSAAVKTRGESPKQAKIRSSSSRSFLTDSGETSRPELPSFPEDSVAIRKQVKWNRVREFINSEDEFEVSLGGYNCMNGNTSTPTPTDKLSFDHPEKGKSFASPDQHWHPAAASKGAFTPDSVQTVYQSDTHKLKKTEKLADNLSGSREHQRALCFAALLAVFPSYDLHSKNKSTMGAVDAEHGTDVERCAIAAGLAGRPWCIILKDSC